MKLFAVYLKGSLKGFNPAYSLAEDSNCAYKQVLKWLQDNDYGFACDREMDYVELIADTNEYGYTQRLFLFYINSMKQETK